MHKETLQYYVSNEIWAVHGSVPVYSQEKSCVWSETNLIGWFCTVRLKDSIEQRKWVQSKKVFMWQWMEWWSAAVTVQQGGDGTSLCVCGGSRRREAVAQCSDLCHFCRTMGLVQLLKSQFLCHLVICYVFLVSGVIVNLLQLCTLPLWLINKQLYRRINIRLGYCISSRKYWVIAL